MKTFMRLLGFLRPFTGWMLLSILLGSAAVASGIGLLGTSASIIARAALHPSIAALQVAIVGVRFFGLSRGVFRYLERLTSHSVNFRLLAQLRGWFYRTIEPIAPVRLIGLRSGDLLSRAIADIDTLENFYVRVVAPPISAGVIIIGVGWFAGSVDLAAGLVLVGGLLIGGLMLPVLGYFISRGSGQALVEARSRISAALVEGLQGISDLTAFGWNNAFIERVRRENSVYSQAQRRNGWLQAGLNLLGLLTAQLTVAAVLWIAIPGIQEQRIEGYLLAVLALVGVGSFEAVTPLAQAAQQLESSLQAARRLFAVTEGTAGSEPAPRSTEMLDALTSVDLSVQNLIFRYPGNSEDALGGIDFELPTGKKLAVIGPSGAGKSTLVNLLLRFLPAADGTIRLNGRSYQDYSEEDCRRCFAIISQSTYLFSASIRQNLLMARQDASERDLYAAIERARLDQWLRTHPAGLDSWVGEHGLRLSGGERQRLALARVLLRDAPILLLDEPTAHLDPLLEEQILAELLEACAGKSLILITHRLAGMDRMDEILVLDRGQVVERGNHAALLASDGLYARMWAAQRSMFNQWMSVM